MPKHPRPALAHAQMRELSRENSNTVEMESTAEYQGPYRPYPIQKSQPTHSQAPQQSHQTHETGDQASNQPVYGHDYPQYQAYEGSGQPDTREYAKGI